MTTKHKFQMAHNASNINLQTVLPIVCAVFALDSWNYYSGE